MLIKITSTHLLKNIFSITLKIALPVFSLMLTAGCSGNYTVSTNLDKENFRNYFAASQVTVYKNDEVLPSPNKLIGLVEGQDCQLKVHHASPSELIAKQAARRKAFNKKANGVVFTGCILIENEQLQDVTGKQCLTTLVCYGKAYRISEKAD
ncbi:MAG: rcsF protein [Alteromonadaceae bacterium]|nr:rcsF protein [Alteromonadaceae bacterium]